MMKRMLAVAILFSSSSLLAQQSKNPVSDVLRKMLNGDEVLFYHSDEDKAVVGIAKVTRPAYPDPTAKEGDWSAVDLAPVNSLPRSVSLREIRDNRRLKNIPLVRQSRLSVMPLAESEFRQIVKMGAR